jgi:multicomponent Na+:H+ antiporter subunit C
MEILLALVSGTLYASGIYLMLKRRLAQLIVGLSMIANASNLLIFTSAGLMRERAPILPAGEVVPAAAVADPVPQALVLTAIVIGFGVLAFSLVLARRVQLAAGTDDVEAIMVSDS